MSRHTDPPIGVAQNMEEAQRLLAAQSSLYTSSKTARDIRVGVVLLAAVCLALAAALSDGGDVPVGVVGGLVVLIASLIAAQRQQSRTELAVAVQERFDTQVFQLKWNSLCVRRTPTGQEVAGAASKYRGDRTRDWYPDTGTAERPLDILICQQANLGWGAFVHRSWAWLVVTVSIGAIALGAVVWWGVDLTAFQGMNILALPALPLLWEASDEVRRHFESAKGKDETQQLVLSIWQEGLTNKGTTASRCRDIQNEIVHIRRTNAHVPDWFDKRFRGRSEHAMRTSAIDMVAEARRHGRA